ncbi:MAG: hypothetical protein EB120_12690, partial [Proteobacteria bacterium]|nr:hypothetical protein [Pseudomonadota bacterium]
MGRVFHGILTNVNFALKTAFLLFSVFVLLVQSLTQLPSMGGDSTHRLTRSVNLPSTLEPPPLEEEPDLEPWDTHDVTLEFLETPLGKNCERTIMSYMKPYFDYYRNSGIPAHSRINDPIGGALKALVPVSVIAHGGIAKVQKAAAEYQMLYESNRRDPARGQFEA